MEQSVRSLELEKNDILNLYRNCTEENERYKRRIEELQNAESEYYNNYKKIEGELNILRLEKEQFIKREAMLLDEITTLEQQLEQLNRNLEALKQQNMHLKSHTEKTHQEVSSMKQVVNNNESTHHEYQKRITTSNMQNDFMSNELKEVRVENTYLKAELDKVNNQATSYVKVIENERAKQYDMYRYTVKLEEQNNELINKSRTGSDLGNSMQSHDRVRVDERTIVADKNMRYKNGNNYFTDETVQVNVNNHNPKYNQTSKNIREFADIELNNQNVVHRQSNRSSIDRKSEISHNGSRRKVVKSTSGGGRENSEEIEEQLKALKMKFAELCKDKNKV